MATVAHEIAKAVLEDPKEICKDRALKTWLFKNGDVPLVTVMGVLNVLCHEHITEHQRAQAGDAVQHALHCTPLSAINVRRTMEAILSQPFSMTQTG
jgi:hypothetical protein